ncbi:MAG: glyoxalase/bleomycin resistance/extradiol dioxygenase family protein [Chloroflexia bacterium]|nr:glyoxalase/bleomycin resistance/extradiol dioxygenase family protein [Chloroflexia bacterium]
MKIEHIALWANDLEQIRKFYTTYFNMSCGEKYVNETKGFSSYFLSFEGSETRLEIMNHPSVSEHIGGNFMGCGLVHLAISVGNKTKVDELTEKLRQDGYIIASEPRTTGDGYYESAVLDPEGNQVEITE